MQRIDDRIAVFGLFLVALTAWGPNVFGSQAFMMNCIGLAAVSFMTRDRVIIAFGCYVAAWGACIQAACSSGLMPDDAIFQAVDALQLVMSGIAIYTMVRFGKSSDEFWMNAICIIATILSLLGLVGFFKGREVVATLANQNFLAAFLAVSAVCCYGGDRKKWWWCLIPISGCLLATKTSMAIVALFIGTGFYFKGWIGAWLAIMPGVAYFLLFKTPASLIDRLAQWIDALLKISNSWDKVLFGTGPGIYWGIRENLSATNLHSEYVYLLWNFGYAGLAVFVVYLFQTFRRPIGNRCIFAAFLVVLIDGLGNHILHTAPTAYLAAPVIMGLNDRNLAEA